MGLWVYGGGIKKKDILEFNHDKSHILWAILGYYLIRPDINKFSMINGKNLLSLFIPGERKPTLFTF